MKTISIVVPCFNEEEVLPTSAKELCNVLNSLIINAKVSDSSKILFVNDGSKDKTCWMRNKASPSREKLSENRLFGTDFLTEEECGRQRSII